MIYCRRNFKENEGRSLGAEMELKSKGKIQGLRDFVAKDLPCEIATSLRNHFAAPRSRCENATVLRNNFAAQHPPLRKFSQLQNPLLAHECHFTAQ